MYTNLSKKSRRVLIIIFIFLVLILFFGTYNFISRRNKSEISFITAPAEANIKINNKTVGHKVYLTEGSYKVNVSYEGFGNIEETIQISRNQPPKEIPIALSAVTDTAKIIAQKQVRQYTKIEALGGKESMKEGIEFQKNNPISQNLPFKTGYYSIDYGKNLSGEFELEITSNNPLGRQVAIEKIHSWGYDLTDYNIVFVGLDNPFMSYTKQGGN